MTDYYACFQPTGRANRDVRIWRGPFDRFEDAKTAAYIPASQPCNEKMGVAVRHRVYRYGRRFVGTAEAFAHHGYLTPDRRADADAADKAANRFINALRFQQTYSVSPGRLSELVGAYREGKVLPPAKAVNFAPLYGDNREVKMNREAKMLYYTTGLGWQEAGKTWDGAKRCAGVPPGWPANDLPGANVNTLRRYGGVFIGTAAALADAGVTYEPLAAERKAAEKARAEAAKTDARLQSVTVATVGRDGVKVTACVPGTSTRRWVVSDSPAGVQFTRFAGAS